MADDEIGRRTVSSAEFSGSSLMSFVKVKAAKLFFDAARVNSLIHQFAYRQTTMILMSLQLFSATVFRFSVAFCPFTFAFNRTTCL
jgi:hypothetical protein